MFHHTLNTSIISTIIDLLLSAITEDLPSLDVLAGNEKGGLPRSFVVTFKGFFKGCTVPPIGIGAVGASTKSSSYSSGVLWCYILG